MSRLNGFYSIVFIGIIFCPYVAMAIDPPIEEPQNPGRCIAPTEYLVGTLKYSAGPLDYGEAGSNGFDDYRLLLDPLGQSRIKDFGEVSVIVHQPFSKRDKMLSDVKIGASYSMCVSPNLLQNEIKANWRYVADSASFKRVPMPQFDKAIDEAHLKCSSIYNEVFSHGK